ncbi:MAG: DUF971 domain-containing protein [Acidobacteria bacterium]|jgi:DUF971 family protein|nr:DUF971 domain-containing protein [Acidobacteriota bacterium]
MIEPIEIVEETNNELLVRWSDGKEDVFHAAYLRKSCPCAGCINEWTGEKILKPDQIVDDLSFSSISIVGRYALNFRFSDGHETGIYSFQYLRDLPKEN